MNAQKCHFCYIYCAQVCTRVHTVVIVSCAVSNRESRYTLQHYCQSNLSSHVGHTTYPPRDDDVRKRTNGGICFCIQQIRKSYSCQPKRTHRFGFAERSMTTCKVNKNKPVIAANDERNRCDSEDILWAFVFGSRIAHDCALSQLSLCTHNPDRSLYNYFSISVQFFSSNGPSFF